MRKYVQILILICFTSICLAQPQITLVELANGFLSPVAIANAGDDRLFICEIKGIIKIVDTTGSVYGTSFLDIKGIIKTDNNQWNERGLLSLAFHPDYSSNGYFFVNYTDNSGDMQISRFSVSGDPNVADAGSEVQVINIGQPDPYHNGGCIQFGPDGYLYIGNGDGAGNVGGDPNDDAQNKNTVLGAMLRLNVDNLPYTNPATNPYVGVAGLDEIWSIGLRNPWRFSFDRTTGDMWIADVGQNKVEEINMEPASSSGGVNYGWNCLEATSIFNAGDCNGDMSIYTDPVFEYAQKGADCGIIGGYMYRGSKHLGLIGHYVFTDYCRGTVHSIYDNGGTWTDVQHLDYTNDNFSSFGEDASGEMYVAGLVDGKIYRIEDLLTSLKSPSDWINSTLSPNPVIHSTKLTFKNAENRKHSIRIFNSAGQEVYSEGSFSGSEVNLDLSRFEKGVYFYSLSTGKKVVSRGKITVIE